MISITFGLGASGTREFFPESDFSVILEDEEVISLLEDDTLNAEVSEDSIIMEVVE